MTHSPTSAGLLPLPPMLFSLPNIVTWIRIGLIPLFALVYYLPFGWARPVAAVMFGVAAGTDWLDGYLARRLQQTSAFGAFLDPVADKLIVAVALVILVQADPRLVVALPAAIIIGREITVSALREWMAAMGARAKVAVTVFAKIKTIVQMVGIAFMLYYHDLLGLPIYDIGLVLLALAAVLTLWSMVLYLRAAWPSFNSGAGA